MDYSLRNGLKKPGNLDYAVVEDFNENVDIIDAILAKANFTSTVDPTVNDDELSGYTVGSIWMNQATNKMFVLKNQTTGAAIWSEILTDAILAKANFTSTVNPTVNDDELSGYTVGSIWMNQATNKMFVLKNQTTGAAIWSEILTINSNKIGIGITAPSYNLHIYNGNFGLSGTVDDVSENTANIRKTFNVTKSASLTYNGLYIVPYINITNDITNSGRVTALYLDMLRNRSGDSGYIGTLDDLSSVIIVYGHNNTAAISPITITAYGMKIVPYIKTGTITTMYDIYLSADSTGGTVTNRWGFYQANTAKNYFGGYVGIGITPTVGLQLPNSEISGKIICYDLYAYNNVSALTFTDRTDAFLGDGIEAIRNIKADENGQIDHNTLPEFARSKYTEITENGEIVKDGRDVGNMVSVLTTAMQQLINKVEIMNNKIIELEEKITKLESS